MGASVKTVPPTLPLPSETTASKRRDPSTTLVEGLASGQEAAMRSQVLQREGTAPRRQMAANPQEAVHGEIRPLVTGFGDDRGDSCESAFDYVPERGRGLHRCVGAQTAHRLEGTSHPVRPPRRKNSA